MATFVFFEFVFRAIFKVALRAGGVFLSCRTRVSDLGLAIFADNIGDACLCIDTICEFLPVGRSLHLLDTKREPWRFILLISGRKGGDTKSWDLQIVIHSCVLATTQRRSPDFALMISGSKAKALSSNVCKLNEL
jgi:hypothetical protein